MQKNKEYNIILAIAAIILGVTLFKNFNFQTFELKIKPALAILYLIVFVVCMVLLFRRPKAKEE